MLTENEVAFRRMKKKLDFLFGFEFLERKRSTNCKNWSSSCYQWFTIFKYSFSCFSSQSMRNQFVIMFVENWRKLFIKRIQCIVQRTLKTRKQIRKLVTSSQNVRHILKVRAKNGQKTVFLVKNNARSNISTKYSKIAKYKCYR